MTAEEKEMCPLCMEPMEADDLVFYPCDCRYQVCRFCWAKIINEENGLCPACRKEYNSDKPASYKPVLDGEELRLRPNRKRKDYVKKTKLNAEMLKVLPELRVVQPNLIFVVGLPTWISKDKDILKGQDYFGRYGKIFKVEVNQNQTFGGPQGQPSFSAYITFYRSEDAMRSIQDLNQSTLHGRPIRVSLGTTKYCSQFLRGTKCTKHECMYLHELGDSAASFTKEEMQAGKHTEYMNKLLQEFSKTAVRDLASQENTSNSSQVESGNFVSPKRQDVGKRGRSRHENNSESILESVGSKSQYRLYDRSQSQPGQNADSRTTKNSAVGEGRRTKHYDKNHIDSTDDYARSNYSSDKSIIWNNVGSGLEHVSTNSKRTNKLSQSNPSKHYGNYEAGSLNNTAKTVGSGRFGQDNQMHADFNLTAGRSLESNPIDITGSKVWCKTLLNSKIAAVSVGEDPVDIDFDPFRESQQGLAELLAAELAQLDVGNVLNKRFATSQPPNSLSFDVSVPLVSHSFSPDDLNEIYFGGMQPLRHGYSSWESAFANCDNSNLRNPDNKFSAHSMHPPPGFEEAVKAQQHSPDTAYFSSQNSETINSRYLDASYPNHRSFSNSNTNHLYENCNPTPNSSMGFSSTGKPDIDSVMYDFWKYNKTPANESEQVMEAGALNTLHQSFASLMDANSTFGTDRSGQPTSDQLLNLFTAAFNTASAIINNGGGATGQTDKSSPRSSFDIGLFLNQLCKHSSLFSSLSSQMQSEMASNFAARNSTDPTDYSGFSKSQNSYPYSSGKYPKCNQQFQKIDDIQQLERNLYNMNTNQNTLSKLLQNNGLPSAVVDSIPNFNIPHPEIWRNGSSLQPFSELTNQTMSPFSQQDSTTKLFSQAVCEQAMVLPRSTD